MPNLLAFIDNVLDTAYEDKDPQFFFNKDLVLQEALEAIREALISEDDTPLSRFAERYLGKS